LERCYDAILAEGLAFHEAQAPLAELRACAPGAAARRDEPDIISSGA
jgi:hypothetical protein